MAQALNSPPDQTAGEQRSLVLGYVLHSLLHEGKSARVWRGYDSLTQQPVILKQLQAEAICAQQIQQLRQEYDLLRQLSHPGIPRPVELILAGPTPCLVLCDTGSQSLHSYLQAGRTISLETQLNLMIQLAQIVGYLHDQGVVHCNLHPGNMVIHPTNLQLQVVDFGLAEAGQGSPHDTPNGTLEGHLAYISPELTGRTNRNLDHRTDLYSLGSTYYELLTGHLPFQATSPMAWVHAHLAQTPRPPQQLQPALPSVLNQIVLKLLAKNAEDRYANAYGLSADLQHCLHLLLTQGSIADFEVGERDRTAQFSLSKHRYGRDRELECLIKAFDLAGQGSTQVVWIEGEAGVGKSFLLQELKQRLPHVPILLGRFEPEGSPYGGIIQAFQGLIRQLLAQPEPQVTPWRLALHQALGNQAQRIVELIPELELLLLPEIKGDGPEEAARKSSVSTSTPHSLPLGRSPLHPEAGDPNWFLLVLRQFVGVFAQIRGLDQPPLVLVLEGLQWADPASLQLLQKLIQEPVQQALLVIGTLRSQEVAIRAKLQSWDSRGAQWLELKPLTLEQIQLMVADSLSPGRIGSNRAPSCPASSHSLLDAIDQSGKQVGDAIGDAVRERIGERIGERIDPVEQRDLGTLIFHRTQGNPFFAQQLLNFWYQQRLLKYDFQTGAWQWDLPTLEKLDLTEDVVDLMVAKIRPLADHTQVLLKLAACFGHEIELANLAQLSAQAPESVWESLAPAVQAGLLLCFTPSIETPPYFPWIGDSTNQIRYQFLHERVRQAVVCLLSPQEQALRHQQIGYHLLKQLQITGQGLFQVVYHLNASPTGHWDLALRQEVAALNWQAAEAAKARAAYDTALHYLQAGYTLLPKAEQIREASGPTTVLRQSLRFNLLRGLGECEYLCGNLIVAEQYFEQGLQIAHSLEQTLQIYCTQLRLYVHQNRSQQAIALALQTLDLLGLPLPQATADQVETSLTQVQAQLADISDITALPAMQDPVQRLMMEVLRYLAAAAITCDRPTYQLAILTLVSRSLRHGNTAESAYAYVAYGVILNGRGNSNQGLAVTLGQAALAISRQFPTQQGVTYFSYGGLMGHWSEPLRTCHRYLGDAFDYCCASGDLLYALYALNLLGDTAILAGLEVSSIHGSMQQFLSLATQQQHPAMVNDAQIKLLWAQSLSQTQMGAWQWPEDGALLQVLQDPKNPPNAFSRYLIYQSQVLYLFGQWDEALAAAIVADQLVNCHYGVVIFTEHFFTYGLILAAVHDNVSLDQQSLDWGKLLDCQQRLQQWSEINPINFLPRYQLLSAEIARIQGEHLAAMDLYDQAIATAQAGQFTQLEALASELAAKYYLVRGKQAIAHLYLVDAHECYGRWGATAKVQWLEGHYGDLLFSRAHIPQIQPPPRRSSQSTPDEGTNLDWISVIKASQALSGEIVLGSLMEKMITIVIENAGAQRGVLLSRRHQQMIAEIEGRVQGNAIKIWAPHLCPETTHPSPSSPISSPDSAQGAPRVPLSVIYYVERTQSSLVLENASLHGTFQHDPYIARNRVKSILCFPIIYQGRISSIIYLENNLVNSVFTTDQIEVLKLITAQVAISLENARLYQDLQTYSHALEQQNVALERSQFQLRQKTVELEDSVQNLKQTQAQLVQTEKMSSLGMLVAGVAHELKNPINFISGNLAYAQEYMEGMLQLIRLYQAELPTPSPQLKKACQDLDLDFLQRDLPKLLSSMNMGTERIQQMIASLRTFSRSEQQMVQRVDLHEGIDGTLLILQVRFKATEYRPAINFTKTYGELPLVSCYPGLLNQVVMNLLANAIDAVDELAQQHSFRHNQQNRGEISLTTAVVEVQGRPWAEIRIVDNGIGLPPQVQDQLFEAFFTTKPAGKGTGLGLSISHQIIVEKHQGQITGQARPTGGSEFMLRIPLELSALD